MKKLIALAAAATCGAALAVESANIVGYATKEIAANTWYMIGCGFQKTSGENFSIQEFASGMPETDDTQEAASIQVWDGTKLVPYYYIAYDWDINDNVLFGWVDGNLDLADFDTPAGFACWMKSPTAFTLTVSGQIVGTDSTTINLAANAWQLVANPYPMDVDLNSEKIDCSGLPETDDTQEAASIQFWNGTKLVPYYYIAYDWDINDNVLFGWVDGNLDLADLSIPAQTGFWAKSPSACSLIWKK